MTEFSFLIELFALKALILSKTDMQTVDVHMVLFIGSYKIWTLLGGGPHGGYLPNHPHPPAHLSHILD